MDSLLEKQMRLEQLMPLIQENLAAGKTVRFSPRGISMLPMLRQGVDSVVLSPAPDKLRKYDIPFYRRDDGKFILHRVVKVRENGYVILGDNCLNKEYGIKEDEVIGVMTSFVRDGKEYPVSHKGYRLYASVWYMLYPIRKVWMIGKGKCRKLLQKVR